MSKRYCTCGAIINGRSRCKQCTKVTKRSRTWRWNVLSRQLRDEFPLCQRCLEQGRTTVSSEVHHLVSTAEAPSLEYERSNLLVVCNECHEELEGRPIGHNGVHRRRGGKTNAGASF